MRSSHVDGVDFSLHQKTHEGGFVVFLEGLRRSHCSGVLSVRRAERVKDEHVGERSEELRVSGVVGLLRGREAACARSGVKLSNNRSSERDTPHARKAFADRFCEG